MTTQLVFEFLQSLLWPATVIILGFGLRSELGALLGRTKTAKIAGAELSFAYGEAVVDSLPSPPKGKSSISEAENPEDLGTTDGPRPRGWAKAANVYWLGNDIMWTVDVVLRGGPRDRIMHGLIQSRHHLNEVMPEATEVLKKFDRMIADVNLVQLSASFRSELAIELQRLSNEIGGLANKQQQPFFDPGPSA